MYAILTLKAVQSLSWIAGLVGDIISAIQRGRKFLRESGSTWKKSQYLWVEKVTYGSTLLSEAYCLAAIKNSDSAREWTDRVKIIVQNPKKVPHKISMLLSSLQAF